MDKKQYECTLCSKQFSTKGNYLQHLQRLTSCKTTNNNEKCNYCSKEFNNKYNRIRHENTVCHEKINKTENALHKTITKEMDKMKETNKILEDKNIKLEKKLVEFELMIKNGIHSLTTKNINIEK